MPGQSSESIMTEEKVKSNSVVTVARDNGCLVFRVRDAGEVRFDPDKVSAENRARAMYHGFEQRIRDRAAINRDTETGLPATPAVKFAELKRMVEHLESGTTDWELRKAAGGGVRGDGTYLARALVRIGKAADVTDGERMIDAFAEKKYGGDRKAASAALVGQASVKKAIGELKAEDAAKAADRSSDDLLSELEGM